MAHAEPSVEKPFFDFDIRPQAVERWIRELPRGSIGKTGELIFRALHGIKLQEIRPEDRFRLLESLRECAHYATSNMNKNINGVAYPFPDRLLRIASASKSIYDHMAHGYLKVFHDLQKQNSLFVEKRMLTTAIHRAIAYIERALLLTYEIYSAFYHDYWEQLHELYQYAELHKLTRTSVADPLMHSRHKSSIEAEYLRTLLLYLAEPYHLRPGEINQVHHQLEHWSALCHLKKARSEKELSESRIPVIALNTDQPPKLCTHSSKKVDLEHCRILDTSKLIEKLREDREKLIKDQPSRSKQISGVAPSISLLRRLIESWEHTRHRRYPRQILNEPVNVTIGLHHAHMQLMYEQHLDNINRADISGFNKLPGFESIEIRDVNDEHGDVWSAVYSWANSANNSSREDNKPEAEASDMADCRVKQDNWTLINECAEGCGLVCQKDLTTKVQVGEVISVQRKNSNERSIGLVRWMKARGQSGIELGVKLLSPSAKPVGLILDDPAKGDHVIDRGLLLPLIPVLNRPESILTFARQFKPGDTLRLNQPDQSNVRIKLIKLIGDNGAISQFLFSRIEAAAIKDKMEPDMESDPEQFNKLWASI